MPSFLKKPVHQFVFGLFCLISVPSQGHEVAGEMRESVHRLLQTMTPEQKAKAQFDFAGEERKNWHFVPKIRNGITLKELSPSQQPLLHALLSSAMSHQGLLKAETIISLEEVLKEMEKQNPRMVRDSELYYLSLFGTPESGKTWGWRFEGHHMSLNFCVASNGLVAVTPSFMGSNPAEIKEGPRKGLRTLGGEEELGRKLVQSLNPEQKKQAIFAEKAPSDIITMVEKRVSPLEKAGIIASQLNADQKLQLKSLIMEYLGRYRTEIASEEWKGIESAGLDNIYFAWAGGINPGEGHYYRVQGSTFLLEYDNTQNNNNHVHAVWRDFKNDFGDDLLQRHYRNHPHP